MMFYKTLKEKANEWNISLRHLQYLCKKGRVEGAVKKGGAWFVPDSAPIPTQYTKTGNRDFRFIGTRKRIFDCAIELIKTKGFEAVSMKDIANAVGITQSSLYNHFKSKNSILDTIYDFYCYYFLIDRPPLEELEPVLRGGSLMDIIRCLAYEFDKEYFNQMTDITIILFNRCAIDGRAREIIKTLMIDEGVSYVAAVFERAVEIGRLAPLDTHIMAVFINSTRIFTLHSWIVNPTNENYMQCVEDESKLFRYACELLVDLKPPDK